MGQWVYEHKLTTEQEVVQWQEVFTPLDPYQTIIIDGNTLPAKTQRQIDRDLAFNAREIRQRDIRKAMQEKEAVQNASQITIGEVRPVTPPFLLLSEYQLLKYATLIHPYKIEFQAAELDTSLQGYFFNGELLSPSTYHLFKYMSKGGVSGLYPYEMAITQLSRTLEHNQQRAATGKDKRQVQFIGRITPEQAGEGVERRFILACPEMVRKVPAQKARARLYIPFDKTNRSWSNQSGLDGLYLIVYFHKATLIAAIPKADPPCPPLFCIHMSRTSLRTARTAWSSSVVGKPSISFSVDMLLVILVIRRV